jgi:membrane-associated protease RseP (regulator of RpoE activity)
VVWILGIVLFALGICLSVALHEAGHLATAKWFGMKVRRYFIGYGPTVWSFRRRGTEYGVKAIPLGGFCDIAGMTTMDEVTPDEDKRAMWRFPAWKRVIVMIAGSVTHFILGFLLLYIMAVTMGLPNLLGKPVLSGVQPCVVNAAAGVNTVNPACGPKDPSPAKDAGIKPGDTVLAVNGKQTPTWSDLVSTVQTLSGPQQFRILQDGVEKTVTVNVPQVQREFKNQDGTTSFRPVGTIGVLSTRTFEYNAWSAVGGAVAYTGDMFAKTWEGLLRFPERIPAVVKAIGGGERDPDTPVSVVGASILGGDAVERGLWDVVLLLLASLNFFIGVFNLLPLLPLDGGHIAVIVYEKIRNALRKMLGKPAGGPVDYSKLMAVTMVVVFIGGAVMLLTITADIVNPIRIN